MTSKLKTPRSASTHSTQDVKARRDGSHAADYRAAEAQRHSQRISDSQHTQIATLLNRLGLPDSGWIARKPVYKSPGWANGFPFTKRDSIRGLMGAD